VCCKHTYCTWIHADPITSVLPEGCLICQAVLSLELSPEAVGGHVAALAQLTQGESEQAGWARRVLKACEALMAEFVAPGSGCPSDRRVIAALFTIGKVRGFPACTL